MSGDLTTRWLDVIADLLSRPSPANPRDIVGRELNASFDATGTSFTRQRGHQFYLEMWPKSLAPAVDTSAWELESVLAAHPLMKWYGATGDTSAQATDFVPSAIADRADVDRWCELAGPYGLRHQLSLPLVWRPDGTTAFVVAREDRPFTVAEVNTARQLQRVLIQVGHHCRELCELPAEGAAQVGLTPRETVVLGLMAQGRTAESIGRHLGCSTRTAHKHLEHAYSKLGAHDRVSAVLRAQDAGVL